MKIKLQKQPTTTSCCQTVVAMLAGVPALEVMKRTRHKAATAPRKMRQMLAVYGWHCAGYQRIKQTNPITKLPWDWREQVPCDAVLYIKYLRADGKKLCKGGHGVLYFGGKVYDSIYGLNPKYQNAVVYSYLPIWPEAAFKKAA